jgi:hypothetical protein
MMSSLRRKGPEMRANGSPSRAERREGTFNDGIILPFAFLRSEQNSLISNIK